MTTIRPKMAPSIKPTTPPPPPPQSDETQGTENQQNTPVLNNQVSVQRTDINALDALALQNQGIVKESSEATINKKPGEIIANGNGTAKDPWNKKDLIKLARTMSPGTHIQGWYYDSKVGIVKVDIYYDYEGRTGCVGTDPDTGKRVDIS